ncbi:hypothetical protein Q4534_00645 [Cyclobacterium sp. 1_MG-2023]|uniref:hypothetical protein n=1 Tax=Cyclobacterium sp. 1_MG-2023 TaxID=3062681 RepID=UPI0026E3F71A|nr:hypothetical protein [Cyclobacterium sp. 1_MG-2023]MDO6435886.1 hypothetical protein [Cyclobacterium sp. 1_MG-2023]
MKNTAVLFMSIMMLIQGSVSFWIMASFYANRDYIIKNECVNRFVPNSACGGQCVLMKKLQQEQDRKQDQAEIDLKGFHLFVYLEEVLAAYLPEYRINVFTYLPYQQLFFGNNHSRSIFRPPIGKYSGYDLWKGL